MTKAEYNGLTDSERYDLLHELWDEIMEEAGSEWIPTPGQVSHCHFKALPKAMQTAIEMK